MEIIKTFIDGLIVFEPKVFQDNRGYFMESFNDSIFNKYFPRINFIQDNESKSYYGVLRGLHFQRPPFEQTKLVRVLSGKILDVAVDIRKNSETFGDHFSIILSSKNKKQLLIPKGFAHGFVVLSKKAKILYKVDNLYYKDHDSGILYNDKYLNINWTIPQKEIILSKKDSNLSSFKNLFIK